MNHREWFWQLHKLPHGRLAVEIVVTHFEGEPVTDQWSNVVSGFPNWYIAIHFQFDITEVRFAVHFFPLVLNDDAGLHRGKREGTSFKGKSLAHLDVGFVKNRVTF